jgi:multicomponent Na+:H+ antiporter subunit G
LREVVISVLVLTGSALSLLAALGLHRFGDAYARLHAATKAATLSLALVLTSAILAHGTDGREVATLLFVLLTSPVSAHMISKAMYETGYRPWEKGSRESGVGDGRTTHPRRKR